MSDRSTPPPTRIAPVIALRGRRRRRVTAVPHPVKAFGVSAALGIGVAASVGLFGLIASIAYKRAFVALPVVAILAAVAVWPATARRLAPPRRLAPAQRLAVPEQRRPMKSGQIRPARGRVVRMPSARDMADQKKH